MFGLKKTVFLKYGAAFTLALAGLAFIACNPPMGMGPIVDTTAPTVIIDKPVDNFVFGNQTRGQPIEFSGRWFDNMGVTELTFSEGDDASRSVMYSRNDGNLTYSVKQDNTWTAGILFEESGDYTIRVTAYDAFRNAGSAVVKIRVHLQDPWIQEKQIRRHTRIASPYTADLKSKGYYEELNYDTRGFIEEIKLADLDYFQNEKFSLRVTVKDGIQISGAGLAVFDENGDPLHSYDIDGVFETPSKKLNERTWEWEIDEALLVSWNAEKYTPGPENMPRFISFEVWAWNEANWDAIGNRPRMNGTYTQEQIGGTCWFPASDVPHILVGHPQKEYKDPDILLNPHEPRAMQLDIFDDDQLAYIYAGLVTREQMNDLLAARGETEAVFIKSLETSQAARNAAINLIGGGNLFDAAENAATGSRHQYITFDTGDIGEYRLIAIAGDNKANHELDTTVAETQWRAHPPLRVFVENTDAPIIIITNPEKQNVLPPLIDEGRKFVMEGYTIDFTGTNYLQIAWLPQSTSVNVAQAQVILQSSAAQALSPGQSAEIGGIKVWKLGATERGAMTLSGRDYFQDFYSKTFDIVNDFTFSGVLENGDKTLVIHTFNGQDSVQANGFKEFHLPKYGAIPTINPEYPPRDLWTHDNKEDLVLRIRVRTDSGIAVDPSSVTIEGTTDDGKDIFTGPVVALGNNVYQRTILQTHVADMQEGVARSYQFNAMDIVGNAALTVDRKITMSNIPILRYIRSTLAPGAYGIGTELRFEAVFSMPVVVTKGSGTGPRLKLYFNDPGTAGPGPVINVNNNDTVGRYANYLETPASSTLIFTYTIKEGDFAALLHTSLDAIDDNGATLHSVEGLTARIEFSDPAAAAENSLQERTQIRLDGVRPYIAIGGAAFINSPTRAIEEHPYYTNGKTVYLQLTANEQVRVAGSPVALLGYKGQTGGGRTTLQAAYTSISHLSSPTAHSVMIFTYEVNDPSNNTEQQLEWFGIQLGSGAAITDIAGNAINMGAGLSSSDGGANPAWIDTRPPAAPTYTIYTANTNTGALTDPISSNKPLYIVISTTETGGKMFYSLNGGSTQISYDAGNNPSNPPNPNPNVIPDSDAANNNSSSYTPSNHQVTAWQTDRAGNRSLANAAQRNVTINSRAPELNSISCPQPDGHYPKDVRLEFKLAFSNQVSANGSPSVALSFAGRLSGYTAARSYIANNEEETNVSVSGSIVTVVYKTESGYNMGDIKFTDIEFFNLRDAYGNALKRYNGNGSEEQNPTRRPITDASSFNLSRSGLIIDTGGPSITGYSPVKPRNANTEYNGGVLETGTVNSAGLIENAQIALTFNKKVTANSGKYVYIRPWNKWAVPPILTVEEHNELYNAAFTNPGLTDGDYMAKAPNTAEYQKRLKWLDHHGLPQYTPGLINEKDDLLAEKAKYNYYAYTTHGLRDVGGRVRPDTTAKWVLAFRHDLYGTTIDSEDSIQRLRDVFNAARWKWQTIPVTAGAASSDGRTITFTLPAPLEPGRIWEVVMDAGAFRDDAGNNMTGGIAPDNNLPTNNNYAGYRFWTPGTAKPVIRADRYSHGDHYHGYFANSINAFPGYGADYIPKIDTRVRIDCETPGATINYDTIRTSFAPRAAKDGVLAGIGGTFNPVFAGWAGSGRDYHTAEAYFDHPYVNQTTVGIYAPHNARPDGWTNDGGGGGGAATQVVNYNPNYTYTNNSTTYAYGGEFSATTQGWLIFEYKSTNLGDFRLEFRKVPNTNPPEADVKWFSDNDVIKEAPSGGGEWSRAYIDTSALGVSGYITYHFHGGGNNISGTNIEINAIYTNSTPSMTGSGGGGTAMSPYSRNNLYNAWVRSNLSGDQWNDIAGFTNNWIGNGGSHQGGPQMPVPIGVNGYFSGLLVPIFMDGTEVTRRGYYPTVNAGLRDVNPTTGAGNGAIAYTELQTLGTGLVSGSNLAGLSGTRRGYRSIAANGTSSPGEGTNMVLNGDADGEAGSPGDYITGQTGYFFYVGEAYGTTNRTARGSANANDSENRMTGTDPRLYSGRRDYVAAAAKKGAVNTGEAAGPALNASAPGYEGVFKTTVVFRAPNGRTDDEVGTYRLLIQGFDTPTNSTIAGFPLNELTILAPQHDGDTDDYYYFAKQAWRINQPAKPTLLMNVGDIRAQNNYFWVSWEIVSDWYLKARHMYRKTNGGQEWVNASMKRDGKNYEAILATYGAYIYRYEQYFEVFQDDPAYGQFFGTNNAPQSRTK